MKRFIILCFLFIPVTVFAHAYPVAYDPSEFSLEADVPSRVSIRFSQAILPNSNGIDFFAPNGNKLPSSPAVLGADNEQTLSRSIAPGGQGIYVVSWHGISAEDGHYTKGAYSFYVGKRENAPALYGGTSDVSTLQQRGVFTRINELFYSPPTHWSVTRSDAGRTIIAEDAGASPGILRVFAYDNINHSIVGSPPIVVVHNAAEGIGPMLIPAKDRGNGIYEIPWAVFTPSGAWHVALTWRQVDAYDISATIGFEYPNEILLSRTQGTLIPLRVFVASVLFLVFSLAMYRLCYTLFYGNRSSGTKNRTDSAENTRTKA